MQPIRILLVDDHRIVREGLARTELIDRQAREMPRATSSEAVAAVAGPLLDLVGRE